MARKKYSPKLKFKIVMEVLTTAARSRCNPVANVLKGSTQTLKHHASMMLHAVEGAG